MIPTTPRPGALRRTPTAALRLLLVLALSGALWLVPRPAAACACGAVVDNADSHVTGETSVLTWDGSRETITMVMSMDAGADDLAWIMPAPAGTGIELGSTDTIVDLYNDSLPRIEHVKDWTPRLPDGDSRRASDPVDGSEDAVRVESSTTVGPFDVVTLSGGDAGALTTWLVDKGYPDRSDLVGPFQDYLDQGWRILAVKLTPQAADESFDEALPPMNLSFDTTEPVYPIRLSSMAAADQWVSLYVVAAHQMDISRQAAPAEPLERLFSGRVRASDAGLETGFDGSDQVWLSAYGGRLSPGAITDDYAFARATSDSPYQRVHTVIDTSPGEHLGLVILVTLGLTAVLVPVVITVAVSTRRRGAGR